ncbi:hypothetical protein PT2222_260074 [Paraburkholderia tropica]
MHFWRGFFHAALFYATVFYAAFFTRHYVCHYACSYASFLPAEARTLSFTAPFRCSS